MINKAKKVREALGLTPTEAGRVLFGYQGSSYDAWMQWENGTKKPSRPTERFFDLILILAKAKTEKIKGSVNALDHVIKELRKM